jgi:hypothetical protein
MAPRARNAPAAIRKTTEGIGKADFLGENRKKESAIVCNKEMSRLTPVEMSGIRPLAAMSTTTDRAPTRYVPQELQAPRSIRKSRAADPERYRSSAARLAAAAQRRKFEIERFPIRI